MRYVLLAALLLLAQPVWAQDTWTDEDVHIQAGPVVPGVSDAAEGYEYRLMEGGVQILPWTDTLLGTDVLVFLGMASSGRLVCVEARAWNTGADGVRQFSPPTTVWEVGGTACRSFLVPKLPPSAPILRY